MSTYEISKSSLLSLKTEILKKQEELQKCKAENKAKLQRQCKKPLELKNKGVDTRAANDGDDINEDLLKKSRSALEAKSKLYDKLSQGSKNEVEKEHNRRYLVHFDKKAHHLPAIPTEDKYAKIEDDNDNENYLSDQSDEEWVEFVDSFGRTRTCLKKDLNLFKDKDKSGPRRESVTPEREELQHDENKSFDNGNEMLSGDMRRELLRQEWEQEERNLQDKSNVHYQDILFSEARSHGVSYYGFSKDEATRIKEQEALNKLRKDTESQQNLAQEVRRNREKQLAARIRAAKNRKRAREGLPPTTSDDEEEKETQVVENKSEELIEREKSLSKEEDPDEIRRLKHVRPWDIGKEGVSSLQEARIRSGTRDPYNQDEWNYIQRSKRPSEFAPPQVYHSMHTTLKHKLKTKEGVNPYKPPMTPTPIDNGCSSSDNSEDELLKDYARTRPGTNVPPPATYEYYGPNSKRAKMPPHSRHNMEDAIMAGLKYLRQQAEQNKP